MTIRKDVRSIAKDLSDSIYGGRFDCQVMPGDEVEVLQVIVGDIDEFPIYISATDTQLLYITYLWREADVQSDHRVELLESMLEMNIPIPLSTFSRIGEHYVLHGATRRDTSLDAIVIELDTLAENAIDALEAMADFLK